jgi:hypothetical protein
MRAIVGVGLLPVALSLSACSLVSSSLGTSLPISVGASSAIVHPNRCTLSPSGAQVVASGTFKPLPTLPIDSQGQQFGANELLLRVDSSGTLRVDHLVVHNLELGYTNSGVSVGQASWRLFTSVQRFAGLSPTHCVVTLQYVGPGGAP